MMAKLDITNPWAIGQGGSADLAQGADLRMETPTRAAGFVSDWLVPVLQSLTTGALVAGLVIFLMGELTPAWEVNRLKVWAGLALAISCCVWVFLLRDTRKLLRQIENLTGLDLNQDGQIGDQGPRRLEVHVKDGKGHTRIVESEWLGIDDARLIAFSVGMNNGRGLSEGTWGKDRAIFPEGINSFRAFRGKLEEAGLIALINPKASNLGYEVTASGRAFFRRIAALEEYTHTHTHEPPA